MNTDTGRIYHGEDDIRKAQERGEPLRELSQWEVIQAEAAALKSVQRGRSFVRDPRTGLKLRAE